MEGDDPVLLTDPGLYPDEALLRRVLGRSYGAYEKLLALLGEDGLEAEWRYYADGKAWLCKVHGGKKTVLWMSARKGYLKAVVYLPLRLAEGIRGLDLPEEEKARLRGSASVGKSLACAFDLRNREVLRLLLPVIRYKMKSA